ncbi:MAG: TRAP transporter large permease subunit [Deltaproteobacteria bacterium]|nr:TRAP transporter large permease subunit [Deltaproteobacteria bacterium]
MMTFMLILFVVLLILGAPIFVVIGISSFAAIILTGGEIPNTLAVTRLFAGIDKFAVMAVPFYIFAANIMEIGGLSERIVNWARSLVRGMYGGLAVATEVACMAFGALSGAAPATVVAVGRLMTPQLVKEGYDRAFISGLIASSGSVAIIIPPSIAMMLYAAATGASTGALFVGGIVPGIIYGLFTCFYCMWYGKKHNIRGTSGGAKPMGLMNATKEASWALGVPVIILGGIYAGIVTPTEAAALSAIYALFVGIVVYRQITWLKFYQICRSSVVTTAVVMIMIANASIFGWLLTVGQLPQAMASFATELASPAMFLMMVNVILLIAGMFMDPNSLIVILGPIFFYVGQNLGISATHMGVIMTINLAIGMFTPPFGLNLFVAPMVTGSPLAQIYRSVWPFVIISMLALLIITYLPQLTLALPRMVFPGSI